LNYYYNSLSISFNNVSIQFVYSSVLTTSIFIGIKACCRPQISEHCPKYTPSLSAKKLVPFNLPGTASTFTPNDGIAQL
jgi:hypothetical protein